MNDVFAKCDFNLTIGNYFAFAIVALITAPKDLLSFAIDTPCNKYEEASHSSDACGTCLRGFAYNLRKARVICVYVCACMRVCVCVCLCVRVRVRVRVRGPDGHRLKRLGLIRETT